VSNADQTPDPAPRLEGISKQLSELDGRIDSLMTKYTGLPEELAGDQKRFLESVKAKSQSNTPAWIAAIASIAAALIVGFGAWFNAQMTAKTNAALTRFTTLQSGIAKKDLDIYEVARDQIAALQEALETFLFEKKLTKQNDPYRFAADLDRMCTANRFGSRTSDIRDFNDFVANTISSLQHNQDRWKDVDILRKEAQDKCKKAEHALDALEREK
jgi:hypothetical protein